MRSPGQDADRLIVDGFDLVEAWDEPVYVSVKTCDEFRRCRRS
jgi:hypothetical protein